MHAADDVRDLVGGYARWLGILSAVRFGPFYQLAHGLRGLGVINEDGVAALTLAGVVLVLLVALYDRRTYGLVTPKGQLDGKGALAVLAVFLLTPVLLVLWTGAGYGLRELIAVLASAPAIIAATAVHRLSGTWVIAAAAWFGMLYGVIWNAPPQIQAWLHVAGAMIVIVGLVIEHRRMAQRFEAVHA